MPEPSSLASNYTGKTCIGCVIQGKKNGQYKTIIIYNSCDHQWAYQDCNAQAVGYTTGVPASIAAELLCNHKWLKPGVFNIEQLNPDPFLEKLNTDGLPWKVEDYHYDII